MKLWWIQRGEHETEKRWAREPPGPDWYELERDLSPGETVRVVAGRAEIASPAVDVAEKTRHARRATLATALPDILLAVADGADLREELAKALARTEASSGER
ncbi:MAG: hypothetical protein WC683_07890 [bacterium]